MDYCLSVRQQLQLGIGGKGLFRNLSLEQGQGQGYGPQAWATEVDNTTGQESWTHYDTGRNPEGSQPPHGCRGGEEGTERDETLTVLVTGWLTEKIDVPPTPAGGLWTMVALSRPSSLPWRSASATGSQLCACNAHRYFQERPSILPLSPVYFYFILLCYFRCCLKGLCAAFYQGRHT